MPSWPTSSATFCSEFAEKKECLLGLGGQAHHESARTANQESDADQAAARDRSIVRRIARSIADQIDGLLSRTKLPAGVDVTVKN